MSRNVVTIWRATARDQAPDAPACPSDVPEPAWANLLFGGTNCQVRSMRSSSKFCSSYKTNSDIFRCAGQSGFELFRSYCEREFVSSAFAQSESLSLEIIIGEMSFLTSRCLSVFPTSKVEQRYPSLDPLVLDLIPSIDDDSPLVTGLSGLPTDKYFWKVDIEKMAKVLDSYKQDISMRKVGAIQGLENFKETRLKAVQDSIAVRV